MDALPLKVCAKCSQILLTFHQLYLCCLDTKQRFEAMLRDHPTVHQQKTSVGEHPPDGDPLPNGSSELTMGSIMDGIIVDEADFLHYAEDDQLVGVFFCKWKLSMFINFNFVITSSWMSMRMWMMPERLVGIVPKSLRVLKSNQLKCKYLYSCHRFSLLCFPFISL